jgi:hypothetical protein
VLLSKDHPDEADETVLHLSMSDAVQTVGFLLTVDVHFPMYSSADDASMAIPNAWVLHSLEFRLARHAYP